MPAAEAETAVLQLGLSYQLVTDQTAMVALDDATCAERGLERRNRARVAQERQAQTQRAQQPARPTRVDNNKPTFKHRAPSIGGGAIDPLSAAMALALAALTLGAFLRRRRPLS